MSSPPTYDEAMKQLQDLQSRGMSAEEQATVYNAMSAKVQSSSDDVKEGVKKLADQAIKTDRTFEGIRTQLALIDQNDYKDKGGQPVAKLQPTWVKYQRRYIDLLWQSRKAATQTEAYLRDLVNVVFSVVLEKDSTYEDNVKDLTAFANRPNPVKAKEQDDDFTKLQADVTGFVAKFSTFAEAEGAKLAGQITALTSEINALKKELVDLTRLVEQMGIAIGVTVGAGTAGVIAALIVLGTATAGTAIIPILVTGIAAIIGQVSQLIVALQRKITVESSIVEKQRQIDQLSNEQKILEDLLAKLKLCADEGSDMFGRLANFSDMWSTCAEDARNLLKVVANVHTDKGVQARIQLMSSTYKSAADALAYYATCIDGSHLPSPDATQNS